LTDKGGFLPVKAGPSLLSKSVFPDVKKSGASPPDPAATPGPAAGIFLPFFLFAFLFRNCILKHKTGIERVDNSLFISG